MSRIRPLWFLALVLVLIGVLQVMRSPLTATRLPEPDRAEEPSDPTRGQQRYEAVVAAPREARRPPEATYDRACEALWDGLRGRDLAQTFAFPPLEFSLPDPGKCGRVPEVLRSFHERYEQECRGLAEKAMGVKDQEDWRQSAGNCYLAVLFYRANLSEWLTQGIDLDSLKDPGLLADKMMAHFFQNPGRAARIAERLLELEPDLYPAARAAVLGHLMEARRTGKGWDAFEDSLKRAEEMNPGDARSLAETEMVAAISRAKDPREVRQKAESLADRFPDSGLSEYYLAWVEYKQGDRERAMEYLGEACSLNPGERCQRTRARIQRGEKDPFQSSLELRLDFLAPQVP